MQDRFGWPVRWPLCTPKRRPREHLSGHETPITLARGLTLNGVIEYRICQAGAARRGYAPEDFHGFASVVPMADAEIVRLQQQEGYGYMR